MKSLCIKPSKTIRQKVDGYLREGILNYEIKAGQRLVESVPARRIGISRTPIREAQHALRAHTLRSKRDILYFGFKKRDRKD